jgi:crotonobetainyl-CoA:carnitine CoA-transferase CaiB-like acyl-CoA transferase
VQEVVELDRLDESAYLKSRAFLEQRTHPTEGEYLGIRSPVDFSHTPADTTGPAPRIGEHNGVDWDARGVPGDEATEPHAV